MNRLLILAMLSILSSVAQAGFLVTDVSGTAQTDGKAPVALLSELPEGASLVLAAGARLVGVELSSGKEYLLRGAGRYVVEKAGLRAAKGSAIEVKALPVDKLPGVRVPAGRVSQATLVMRSLPRMNVPVPLSPVRTASLTAAPTFRWSPVEGAASYRVTIADANAQIVFETLLSEAELSLPSESALPAGARYSWRIEARNEQGRFADASAEFSVLPAETAARLAQLRPEADAPFARRVLYAVQLQEAGAVAEAKPIWRALSRERPDDERMKSLAD